MYGNHDSWTQMQDWGKDDHQRVNLLLETQTQILGSLSVQQFVLSKVAVSHGQVQRTSDDSGLRSHSKVLFEITQMVGKIVH